MNDEYIGSGKRLRNSINKHGRNNHKIEYLEFYPDREFLKLRETELVNDDLLKDPMCMNLKIGGEGGGIMYHTKEKNSELGRISMNIMWSDPIQRAKFIKIKSEKYIKLHKEGKLNSKRFLDKSHTLETKNKIGLTNSIKQRGQANSQFGTKWINNNVEVKKISQDKLDEYLKIGWKLGRKPNFKRK